MNRTPLRRTALLAAALVAIAAGASGAAGGTSKPAFTQPQYVDTALAGGEPLIMANPVHGTLVYSSHEEVKKAATEAGAYDFIKKGELAELRDSLERLMGLERG